MGLMSSNPYYTGNPWASAIKGAINGWNTSEDRFQAKKQREAELANQDLLRQQQKAAGDRADEEMLMKLTDAAQKQQEQQRLQQAQTDLQTRLAPRLLVDGKGIPTTLGEGLMPPEFKEQFQGPYANPQQAVQQVSNPEWSNALGMMQQQKEVPALPLTTPEIASFGVRMNDKNILEKLIPKDETPALKDLLSGKWTPQSVMEARQSKDWSKLEFAKDPSAVTWSDPYVDTVGGKKAKVQKSSTGQIRPIFEDKSTTIIQREPSRHTEFKDVMALRKEFSSLPEVKDYSTIQAQALRAKKALEVSLNSNSNMPVDQTVITTFNKLLDPSSVVRESEYARTPQDLALLSRIKGKWDKVVQGGAGLPLEERQAMVRMIANFSEIADLQYNDQVQQYTELAKRNGFNPGDVIRLGHNQKPASPTPPSPPRAAVKAGRFTVRAK